MAQALIGYTGFVGGNLLNQQAFDDCYNSSNIKQIKNKSYDRIICAGVPAQKWIANREPIQDRKNIQSLIQHLKTVKTEKFILISTVDVYPSPIDVDEKSKIQLKDCHPYGKHRLELEQFISDNFDSIIIRLPALFGTGLKKNIIFDFLNNNNIEQINPKGIFQFYCLDHLSKDIEIAQKSDLQLINISSEPTSVTEIAKLCLGHQFINEMDAAGIKYDYKSCYAEDFGGNHGYLYSKDQVLSDLKAYIDRV
jgi:nucleoside-diphosphate-sugar epimerase